MLRWLKKRLVAWLLSNIDLGEIKVDKLRIGNTIIITSNTIKFEPLTSDPPSPTAGTVWFRSGLGLSMYDGTAVRRIPTRSLYAFDETEKSVYGTTETEIKNFNLVRSSSHGFPLTRVYVVAEVMVTGGTGYLSVYVAGTKVIELSTTSTSYTMLTGSASVSLSDNSINSVSVRLRNSGSYTTANRLFELYVEA
ncbi:MAG: hypothetical protein QW599_05430 [Nitrososphaerota archaeon]